MKIDVKVPPSPCLGCGKIVDMAAGMPWGPRPPRPGDYSMCLKCGHLMVFAEDMTLRNPTGKEMIDMAGEIDIFRAQIGRMMIDGRKT